MSTDEILQSLSESQCERNERNAEVMAAYHSGHPPYTDAEMQGVPSPRVFLYCRVSTAQQVDGDGFPRQEALCRAFCEKKGWTVARSAFLEQQTGSDEFVDRPKLSEAMNLCGPGTGVRTIIVERADRVARDLVVQELFFRECKKRGISVYSADYGEDLVNDENETRLLIRRILGALSQWEKAMLAKKLLAGRKRMKMQTGRPCGGPPCYGRQLTEANVIRQILVWYREGVTMGIIAKRLTKITDPAPPHPSKPPGSKWKRATVEHLVYTWRDRELELPR